MAHLARRKTSTRLTLVDLLGWLGMLAVLTGYLLVTQGNLTAHSLIYVGLNIVGSGFLIIDSSSKRDTPVSVLNIAWLIIALSSLAHIV